MAKHLISVENVTTVILPIPSSTPLPAIGCFILRLGEDWIYHRRRSTREQLYRRQVYRTFVQVKYRPRGARIY